MSKPRRRKGVYPQKVRCKATNRWGEQCRKWAMRGAVVCNKHGGAAPQVRRKAQERIMMAQDDAASLLVRFMSDTDVPYSERRRCAEFLLTYENRNDVRLTLDKWQENLGDLFVSYTPDQDEDIIDAEVIEDHRALPPSDWESKREALSIVEDPPKYGRGNRLRNR